MHHPIRYEFVNFMFESGLEYYQDIGEVLEPNVIWGTDILDTGPFGLEATFSEMEKVVYLLNQKFGWEVPLKVPRGYYISVNETSSDQVKKDLNYSETYALITVHVRGLLQSILDKSPGELRLMEILLLEEAKKLEITRLSKMPYVKYI